ncbi:MAG: type II secretion system F family protein [Candidatus Thermoplasmatota archaeon]
MAEEEKDKKEKKKKISSNDTEAGFIKQLQIAYNALDDRNEFYKKVIFPLIFLSIIIFIMPFILEMIIPFPLTLNPFTFVIGGIIPIFLGVFYPFIIWKNKETDINAKMHFFITHLRVLAISDFSLLDILKMLGGKKVYGSLGEELKKISVLSSKWRMPLSKSFRFISERTPSKLLKDFLDRFSQSLDSGVEHREFIETEQDAVLEEYKTMYETSNENIVILNEVYVSLLIAIIFVMSLGIVLPIIMGSENMNTFIYLSSFLLIISEGLLLYLLKSMIPPDEIWHLTGEKSQTEYKLDKLFRITLIASILLGTILFLSKYYFSLDVVETLPFELIIALSMSPLILVGIKTFDEERKISRKESNFLGFIPALGSISAMRGGQINESVYYLSEKDYGVLTKHVKDLYKRLRTRIDDDDAWEWFGVDSGSNYIQRASEMFRESTYAAANPRKAGKMIAENIRKIRDLRFKKLTIINTSISLFAGITFGISFAIYISLVIGRHLNDIMIESGKPLEGTEGMGGISSILHTIPPESYQNNFIIVFLVLVIHCFLMAYTLKMIRGSHRYLTLLFFVPFVWIVAATSMAVQKIIGGMLA